MKQKATKKMHLKDNIRQEAREMNIIPGLHAPLVSVPKLTDAGYITVFEKHIANVYDKATTTVPTVPNVRTMEDGARAKQQCRSNQK